MLVVGPLVILAAASLTASVSKNSTVVYLSQYQGFGMALYAAGHVLPYVLYSIAFTALFKFIPNTRVNFMPALGGGIFAGVLWQTASTGFAVFASNAGNVNAIYSSFAIVILLLIWIYVSWLILLMGCRVAFLLQHTEQLSRRPYPPRLGAERREELALLMMGLIGRSFLHGDTPWQVERIAHELRAAPDHVYDVVDQLVDAGILLETGDDSVTLLPRQDIECVTLNAILDAVRAGDAAAALRPRDAAAHRDVTAWIERKEEARRRVFDGLTLRALVADEDTAIAPTGVGAGH